MQALYEDIIKYCAFGAEIKCLVRNVEDQNLKGRCIREAIKCGHLKPDGRNFEHLIVWQVYMMLGVKGLTIISQMHWLYRTVPKGRTLMTADMGRVLTTQLWPT